VWSWQNLPNGLEAIKLVSAIKKRALTQTTSVERNQLKFVGTRSSGGLILIHNIIGYERSRF
jgi:hypothetical protein